MTVEGTLAALRRVAYPGFSRDIVALGVVRDLKVDQGRVEVVIDPGPDPAAARALAAAVREALSGVPGVSAVEVQPAARSGAPSTLRMAGAKPTVASAGALDAGLLPHVRSVIAVASGKGGVGKSTVAVNLAAALALQGASVGLLDADIYGPSIPLMMGTDAPPELNAERKLIPFERFGVRFMSLGFLVSPEQAVIWRGPMVMKAIDQLLRDVVWGTLDFLVVDLPPGTGDAQLTISQKVRLSGAIIVTTPQDVALADARKGVAMFVKVGVPILGLVENMSYFVCPGCGERSEIFAHGGGRREAERLGVPFLGEIPLDPAIRRGGDEGHPLVRRDPDSPQSVAFGDVARAIRRALDPAASPDPSAVGPGLFERFRRIWGPPSGS